MFVALRTGYGKNLHYVSLLGASDRLKGAEKTLIVVIVSPLVALMKDQVVWYSSNGVSAACISQEGLRNGKRSDRRAVPTGLL